MRHPVDDASMTKGSEAKQSKKKSHKSSKGDRHKSDKISEKHKTDADIDNSTGHPDPTGTQAIPGLGIVHVPQTGIQASSDYFPVRCLVTSRLLVSLIDPNLWLRPPFLWVKNLPVKTTTISR